MLTHLFFYPTSLVNKATQWAGTMWEGRHGTLTTARTTAKDLVYTTTAVET